MITTVPEIFTAAVSLSDGDRAALAFELLSSLKHPGTMDENDAAFLDELDRRVDALDRGETKVVAAKAVEFHVHQALRERRRK
ncbi:MAG: addiction module protein [Pirellulales bacterium]|nr:addiction module protein [Pirellulales bacterium]